MAAHAPERPAQDSADRLASAGPFSPPNFRTKTRKSESANRQGKGRSIGEVAPSPCVPLSENRLALLAAAAVQELSSLRRTVTKCGRVAGLFQAQTVR